MNKVAEVWTINLYTMECSNHSWDVLENNGELVLYSPNTNMIEYLNKKFRTLEEIKNHLEDKMSYLFCENKFEIREVAKW